MLKESFQSILRKELYRLDAASISKRNEKIIEGFAVHDGHSPKAIIKGKEIAVFNSNDYLGLRLDPLLKKAEEKATQDFGTGPGAVRFISGTSIVHKELEHALAKFHGREECILFSSAFAANLAVIHAIAKGQSKDALISDSCLIISDELNHRSIIDGVRVANFPKEQRAIFKHMDAKDLGRVLEENKGKWKRVIVVTDGIFSMLGEFQDLLAVNKVIAGFEDAYEEGIVLIVDDCHGVAAFGKSGRGTEEESGGQADLLVGTLGKGFGAEGGYIVGDKLVIDYLRESSATYIYSNPISPGAAAASAASVKLIESAEGKKRLQRLHDNIVLFKKLAKDAGFAFGAISLHPIQPILIGDAEKTRKLAEALFKDGVLVTNINYPVVPKGKDEIRVQISANHTDADINEFIEKMKKAAKTLQIV
jgi:glycine C-acetyltransferase